MNRRGVDYTVIRSEIPGVWHWQFRIGELVKKGKTKRTLNHSPCGEPSKL